MAWRLTAELPEVVKRPNFIVKSRKSSETYMRKVQTVSFHDKNQEGTSGPHTAKPSSPAGP